MLPVILFLQLTTARLLFLICCIIIRYEICVKYKKMDLDI